MADVQELAQILGEDVQPSSPDAKLSPEQLERAIRYAIGKYGTSADDLDDQQVESVLIGASAWCYWKIAAKYAEGMMIQIEQDEFYGQQPYEHYIALARSNEELFDELCGGAMVEVTTARRRSLTTGRIVPLAPGDFK